MYCQVTIRVTVRGESREVWFVLEVGHDSLEGVFEQLKADGALHGTRIETRPSGEGERRVVDAYETILMRDSIVAISELQFDLVDEHGRALFLLDPGDEGDDAALRAGM